MTEYKRCPECKRPIHPDLFEVATAHQNGSKCRKLLLKKARKEEVKESAGTVDS